MLGLTRRELETELRDGLRHRQRAKAVGNCYSPIPKATAPVLDPTCEGCALQAHGKLWPEMATLAKPSQQPRTESCVVCGNNHCEA
jgi:hypothetical protein